MTGTTNQSDDEFTCAACGGTFTKDWTDEEAAAEAVANGFTADDGPLEVICEDCYRALGLPKVTT